MRYFTSEQIACGHPDKVCDRIADTLLDAYRSGDPSSRVAIEVLMKNDLIVLAGEVTSSAQIDIEKTVQTALDYVGLKEKYTIQNHIFKQSPDIAMGVDTGGAGDQGIMFGFACNETPECLPLSYMLATAVLKELRELNDPNLGADAKSQVTVAYGEDGSVSIDTFLVSTQHCEAITEADVREIVEPLMKKVAREYGMNEDFKVLVNPTGRFVIGGSFGDAGVTGRKIICDTYGGGGRHGGGAFSGKDATKVDRTAAYMARYLAKSLLKKHGFHSVEVQLAYVIGLADPCSAAVWADGEWREDLEQEIRSGYDLTPRGIISFLGLNKVKFSDVSSYGHFTNQDMPWEKV
ncbi:MAG: methionine adenosyltransferase [Oscillospiraceae bacterium]|nr:methionine adenosyltransferase [Oscillospiraceae bacterium]